MDLFVPSTPGSCCCQGLEVPDDALQEALAGLQLIGGEQHGKELICGDLLIRYLLLEPLNIPWELIHICALLPWEQTVQTLRFQTFSLKARTIVLVVSLVFLSGREGNTCVLEHLVLFHPRPAF